MSKKTPPSLHTISKWLRKFEKDFTNILKTIERILILVAFFCGTVYGISVLIKVLLGGDPSISA